MDQMPLLTLEEVKDFLDIRREVTKNDARLLTLIAMATNDIESATRRRFTRQPYDEFFTTRTNQRTDYDFRGSSDYITGASDSSGLRTITSPQSFALAGVNIDPETVEVWYNPAALGPADFTDEYKLEAEKHFQIDWNEERLFLYVPTVFRLRSLRVKYTAGYEPALPEDTNEDETDVVETLSASIPTWLRDAALVQVMFLNIKLRPDNINMGAERTVSDKGKVASSQFLKTNGLSPEVIPMVAHLKRTLTGKG